MTILIYLRFPMRKLVLLFGLFFSLHAFNQDLAGLNPLMMTDDTAKVRVLNTLSLQEIYSNPSRSVTYLEQALQLAQKLHDYRGLAESYINYGKLLSLLENEDLASTYYFDALKIGEQKNDEYIIAIAKNYIATLYISLNSYEKAGEYLLDAIALNRKNKEKNLLAANYNNIGMVYSAMQNYTTAIEYFLMSLEINQQLGNTDWISNNYGNLGATYSAIGNPKAIDYFHKRIELKQELGDKAGVASGNKLLGEYYISQNNYSSAIGYLSSALDLALFTNSWEIAADCNKLLSQAQAAMGNWKEAYYRHVQYLAAQDSSNKKGLSKTVLQLELQHEYDKVQRAREEQLMQQKLRYYIVGSGFLALLVILLLLFLNQKGNIKRVHLQKRMLEEELEHKNRELTTNMLYLLKKNELIECISGKLIELRKNVKKENQQVIQQVISDLRSNLDNNVWEEFEIRFKDVHGSFYENLQRDFSELTVGERRLCAFLRMDMSTKEISAITGQSLSSIEVARTRLRKKLGISNTQIGISQFLSKY